MQNTTGGTNIVARDKFGNTAFRVDNDGKVATAAGIFSGGLIEVHATSDAGLGLKSTGGNISGGIAGAGIEAHGGTLLSCSPTSNICEAGNGINAFGGDANTAGNVSAGSVGIFASGGNNGNGTRGFAGVFDGDVSVNGCVRAGVGVLGTCSSDSRLKKNIQPFPAVLDKLVRLQPVSYSWRTEEYPQFRFSSGRSTGLVAQEVEKVFPDMVSTDEAGYKRVNYGELPYLMLQAIRELKADNDELKAENDDLRECIQRLEAAATRTP